MESKNPRREARASVVKLASDTGIPTRKPTAFAMAHAYYVAIRDHYNTVGSALETTDKAAHDRMERQYLAALEVVESTPVATWSELVDALEVSWDGFGSVSSDVITKILADAHRLDGRAP